MAVRQRQLHSGPPQENQPLGSEMEGKQHQTRNHITIESEEMAEQVAKAVRVREATYAALRKKKDRGAVVTTGQQDPAVPPGQRVVKK